MSPENFSVDVLIVGAGPTGLFAAYDLLKLGFSVRIIDIEEEQVYGRATAIHCRTLEILDQVGLIDEFLAQGLQTSTWRAFKEGVEFTVPPPNYSDTFYKYCLQLRQFRIEKILISEIAKMGVEIQRSHTITTLDFSDEKNSYPLSATICDTRTESDTIIRAKYILGCDGSRSWVRNRLGIAMVGDTTEYIWGRIDANITTDFPAPKTLATIQSEKYGTLLYVPIDSGLVRLGFPLFNKLERHDVRLEELIEQANRSMKPFKVEFNEINWWTVYRVSQRIAEQYSVERRVFLCGDACHIQSSAAAQGLNIGFLDAHNLAWKIFWKERGAKAIILDTYETERKDIAKQINDIDQRISSFTTLQKAKSSPAGISEKFDKELIYVYNRYEAFHNGLGVEYCGTILSDKNSDAHFSSSLALSSSLEAGQRAPDFLLTHPRTEQKCRLHKAMPFNGCFYFLVFAGGLAHTVENVRIFENYLKSKESPFKKFEFDLEKLVRIIKIATEKGEDGNGWWWDLEGGCHARYGVDVSEGLLVVVRPDGWIGRIFELNEYEKLEEYFSGFLNRKCKE